MTDSSLRTAIARALHDLYWTKYQNKDGTWCEGNWLLSKIEREEYLEEADAVLKVLADPDEETVERAAQAEHWHDFEQGDAVLTWDLMTEMARGFYRDEARRMLRAAIAAPVGGEQDD